MVPGVALGKGDGTFGAVIPYPDVTNGNGPAAHVAVGDFNHDGQPDVAVSAPVGPQSDGISILVGNGTGSFTPFSVASPNFFAPPSIGAIAAGDLNADGYSDLVATGSNPTAGDIPTGYISAMFNDGTGHFGQAADDEANLYNTRTFPGSAIALADVNGDGRLDVVAGAPNTERGSFLPPSSVSVILNNGKGGPHYVSGFGFPQTFIAAAGPNEGVVVADFNKDGAPDIAVTSQLGVSLLFHSGVVSVTPSTLTWATVQIGQTGAVKTLTVQNLTGSPTPLTVAIGGSMNTSQFRIYSDGCNGTLAANASCTVTLAFRPSATGKRTDTLTISDANGILANVSVSGIGAQP
jgi:FG-GAP-like repeat/FG-GAP repeat/Abnormal spindle-like microcephaly-assoc'd, ASPM-SPD-2-Hydin